MEVHGQHQNRGDDGVQAGSQKHGRIVSSVATESKPIDLERLATVLGGIESIEYTLVLGSSRRLASVARPRPVDGDTRPAGLRLTVAHQPRKLKTVLLLDRVAQEE